MQDLVSPPGSTREADCVDACGPGYAFNPDQTSCIECEAGMFQDGYAQRGDSCQPCPTGSYSAPGAVKCECQAGWTRVDGNCLRCVAGKYKSEISDSPCTDCVAGKFSESIGATSESTCSTCPSGSYSSIGSVTCSQAQKRSKLTRNTSRTI